MKKLLLGIVFSLAALSGPVFAATFPPQPAMPWVDTKGHATLSAAASAAAARGVGVLVSTNMTISTATTVTVPIQVVKGGKFTGSGGSASIDFSGSALEAGRYQIFFGTLTSDKVTGLREFKWAWFGFSSTTLAPYNINIGTGDSAFNVAYGSIDPWFHINSNGIGAVGNGTTVPYFAVQSSPSFEINTIWSVNPSGQYASIASTSNTGLFPVFRVEAWGDLWLRAGKGASDLVDNQKQVKIMGYNGLSVETFSGAQMFGVLGPYGLVSQPVGTAVVSAGTITILSPITHVTGTAAISTVTADFWSGNGEIELIPDGAWSMTTAGNIARSVAAEVGRVVKLKYDASTAKWYPSYTGTESSIGSAPTYTGQMAVVSNKAYIATSTTNTAGWKQATPIFYMQATPNTSVTGTTVEKELWSTEIPGGRMGPNGRLVIEWLTTQTNNADTKTFYAYLGGTKFTQIALASSATHGGINKIINTGAENTNMYVLVGMSYGGTTASPSTSTLDTSQPLTLSIRSSLTTTITNTVTLKYISAEIKQGD